MGLTGLSVLQKLEGSTNVTIAIITTNTTALIATATASNAATAPTGMQLLGFLKLYPS